MASTARTGSDCCHHCHHCHLWLRLTKLFPVSLCGFNGADFFLPDCAKPGSHVASLCVSVSMSASASVGLWVRVPVGVRACVRVCVSLCRTEREIVNEMDSDQGAALIKPHFDMILGKLAEAIREAKVRMKPPGSARLQENWRDNWENLPLRDYWDDPDLVVSLSVRAPNDPWLLGGCLCVCVIIVCLLCIADVRVSEGEGTRGGKRGVGWGERRFWMGERERLQWARKSEGGIG